MFPVEPFIGDAMKMTEAAFVSTHGALFLLKPPSAGEAWDSSISWDTRYVSVDAGDQAAEAEFAGAWRVAQVSKRPGNPFPERITIGRARNCDIVIRMPQVSKLHAVFLVRPGGGLALCDRDSTNGTSVNGEAVTAGQEVELRVGDWIRFGDVHAELIDGPGLYQRLRTGLSRS